MLKSIPHRRLIWLSLLVVLAYCGMGWRLVDLQVFSAAKVRQAYAKGAVSEYVELPRRGDILDRNGATLTTSIQLYNIGAEPLHITPYQSQVAALLAGPLEMDVRTLRALLTPQTNITAAGEARVKAFVMLKRGATLAQWSAVREVMRSSDFGLDLKRLKTSDKVRLNGLRRFGVRLDSEYQTRQYPSGNVAGQLLGYVGNFERRYSIGAPVTEEIGLAGLERAYHRELAGVPGYRRIIRTELTDHADEHLPAADGMNLVTTIDRRIQEILDLESSRAQVELGAKAVFGTVMDVRTGELLATASAPLFDPGDRAHFEAERVRLRPLLDEYEPGSVFKVIAISGALEDGVVELVTPVDCMNGLMPVRGMPPLTDLHGGYDVLSVKGIITKSSNIGTAQVVRMHGHERYYQWLLRFGIGSRTGVGLREAGGRVKLLKDLYPGEFTRLPIGYGVQVTQLQLATIYSAIANGGYLMQPRLVARLEDRRNGTVRRYGPERVRQVMSRETSQKMIEALRTVTEPGGTAVEAALEHYSVAGKTGTAHKWNPEIRNYDNQRYYSSFVGFFPASNPVLCIAITVDEPDKKSGRSHYGGKAAGPIFKRIAEQVAFHLHLPPDRIPEQEIAEAGRNDRVSVDAASSLPFPNPALQSGDSLSTRNLNGRGLASTVITPSQP